MHACAIALHATGTALETKLDPTLDLVNLGGEVFFNMPVHSAAAHGRCSAVTRTGLVRRLQVRRTPQLGEGCPCT